MPKAAALPALVPDQVAHVPPERLYPDPHQPRTEFDSAKLEELAADIKIRGIEQPIRIRADWTIKHGERRWRAAMRLKLKTVPVLLTADPADESNAAITHYLDQAADNHHQQPLAQLDWARFLKKLTTEYGAAVKDVPDLLAARGITMSRSYVSNTIRLLELPEWAQRLIVAGELAAAHGKYLLMAKPSAKAMKKLQGLIEDAVREAKDPYGQPVTGDAIEQIVFEAFDETHTRLNTSYGDDAPRFSWQKECKTCPDRHEIMKNQFCLNRTCYDAKQDKAKQAAEARKTKKKRGAGAGDEEPGTRPRKAAAPKPKPPTKFKLNEQGVANVGRLSADKYEFLDSVGTKFEPAMHCEGCEFHQLAVAWKNDKPRPACFNVAHYAQLQRQGSREEAIAQWLDQRVIPLLREKIAADEGLQFQLIAWMALGAGTQTSDQWSVQDRLKSEQARARRKLNLRALGDVVRACDEERLPSREMALLIGFKALARDRAHLYAFARYADVKVTAAVASVDREYLEVKRKSELIDLITRHGVVTDTLELAQLEKAKLAALQELCLTRQAIERIGVPYDVALLYEKLEPIIDPDDEWNDDLEDDEQDEHDADDDAGGEDTPIEAEETEALPEARVDGG